MTNQEVMAYIKSIWCESNLEVEVLDMAIEALGKSDKYKWHDLRNNPEDLPKEHVCDDGYVEPSDRVLVKTSSGEYLTSKYWGNRRSKGKYSLLKEFEDWLDIGGYRKVIAWKEIEPFVGDDNYEQQ